MDTKQPNALRLADALGRAPKWQQLQAAAKLRRQHAEIETLRSKLKTLEDLGPAGDDVQILRMGYAAARLEIESLQARIQELGQMARECSDRKVVQLESALAMHVRSGKDWAMRVEALERTITTLRAHIASLNAQVAAEKKAMRELESANSIALQLDARIKELEAQLDAVGAGGVEPLRKRECLHKISEPAQPVAQAQDAARYQFLRDGEWRDTELEPFIRLQLNTMRDAKIDAAISSLQGGANG